MCGLQEVTYEGNETSTLSGVTRNKRKSKFLDFLGKRRNSESHQAKLEAYLQTLLTLALDFGSR
jgi:hypothetical protein